MASRDDRQYYRLPIPMKDHCSAEVCGSWYPIVEISECGLRLLDPAGDLTPEENPTGLYVALTDDECRLIPDARCARRDGDEVVFVFDHGLPRELVFGEQRRLIRRAKANADGRAMARLRTRPEKRAIPRPAPATPE